MHGHVRNSFPHPPLRIGAVSYLNSKPLIEDLAELAAGAELVLDVPSRLADELSAGRLDVALIPSIEVLRDPNYEVVSDACVATRGAVLSVKLYFRAPPGDVRSLALDEGSRTSATLARILLEERFGVRPSLRPLPLGANTQDTVADAVLVIGDRAMHSPEEHFVETWDLGEEWIRWTGLPFVFAMWATRRGTPLHGLDDALASARDRGVSRLSEIARREAPALGLSDVIAHSYLARNLHFQLGPEERSGLRLFHDLAVKRELAARFELNFRPTTTVAHAARVQPVLSGG